MEYFKGIDKIKYEGRESKNPLAFKWYDEELIVNKKSLKEHLRFAVAYWHSFCGNGADPFGDPTKNFLWNENYNPDLSAKHRMEAAFEFIFKLGVPYYCFHDTDLVGNGSVFEIEMRLSGILEDLKTIQEEKGVKLLWGTANLFSHPRYMNGAATNPDFDVISHAAVQVKNAIDATVFLGGENYVFWGGREGYMSLWNTDTKREIDHLGHFFRMARDYGRKIGFTGNFYIEPKPMEPSKHQYDFDAATSIAFIKDQGLEKDFSCNIESNHATLAGHSFAHDLQVCVDQGFLGSVDANQGDPQNGWDTDEFPTNVYETAEAMMIILKNGGLKNGGLNFDAKRRRNSTDLEDLFIAHIGGMDAFALGLEIAQAMISEGKIDAFKKARYASFDSGNGNKFEHGQLDLATLAEIGLTVEDKKVSGKQEMLYNLVNQYMFRK